MNAGPDVTDDTGERRPAGWVVGGLEPWCLEDGRSKAEVEARYNEGEPDPTEHVVAEPVSLRLARRAGLVCIECGRRLADVAEGTPQ